LEHKGTKINENIQIDLKEMGRELDLSGSREVQVAQCGSRNIVEYLALSRLCELYIYTRTRTHIYTVIKITVIRPTLQIIPLQEE
jgi:hypothetical protein